VHERPSQPTTRRHVRPSQKAYDGTGRHRLSACFRVRDEVLALGRWPGLQDGGPRRPVDFPENTTTRPGMPVSTVDAAAQSTGDLPRCRQIVVRGAGGVQGEPVRGPRAPHRTVATRAPPAPLDTTRPTPKPASIREGSRVVGSVSAATGNGLVRLTVLTAKYRRSP
jgi:hypothetical protein